MAQPTSTSGPAPVPVVSQPSEFGGVIGTTFCVLGLPLTVIVLNLACTQASCSIWPLPDIPLSRSFYLSPSCHQIVLAWFLLQAVLAVIPWGKVVDGLPLSNGVKLPYRCNGFLALVVSLLCLPLILHNDWLVRTVVDQFIPLATSAVMFSFLLSMYLYMRSRQADYSELASGGNTGYFVYDFFMGRELNPRIGPLDLKFFCELRPGLIGWVMLDACFITRAWHTQATPPMALIAVSLCHLLYVADALWFEECVLSTMDIVHDGFGFMLAFGDLAWVPFLYCLQARYLMMYPQQWSIPALVLLLLANLSGYTIFRLSNSEKNNFRRNPQDPRVAHLRTMETRTGRRLLISGWWGMVRHPNYLGDLIMATSWSALCGFDSIVPYFYPIYFLILLVHRNARDEASCRHKYGADWDKYCTIVKYRIFPYIY